MLEHRLALIVDVEALVVEMPAVLLVAYRAAAIDHPEGPAPVKACSEVSHPVVRTEIDVLRVVHDVLGACKSATDRRPSASARSAQRRAAVWNSVLHLAEQNRFQCAPTLVAVNCVPHQGQA